MVSGAAHNPVGEGHRGAQATKRPPPLPQAGAWTSHATPPPVSGGAAHFGAAPAAAFTPASDCTFGRLNNLDISGPSSQPPTSEKKRRCTREVGPGKGNPGLRQYSMKIYEKVKSKGRTTYKAVSDELTAEFIGAPDPDNPNAQQSHENNIRRRVYDAFNVLMAMEIICKDKNEIHWKGLPQTIISDTEELKTKLVGLKSRIDEKSAYLEELQDRTRPHATVEVEMSEDEHLMDFDFNSTPFELHDDSHVLKEMRLCGREHHDGT